MIHTREFSRVKRERECVLYNQTTGEELQGIVTDISEGGIGLRFSRFDDKHRSDRYLIQVLDTIAWNNQSYLLQEPILIIRTDHHENYTIVGAKFLNIHSKTLEYYVRDIKSEVFCRHGLSRS